MSQELADTVTDSDVLTGLAEDVHSEVNSEEPWALLERFSELARVSGTEEEVAAAEYIIDRLESFGVEYERFDPELYISQPHGATLQALDRPFEPGPVKTISFSTSETVSGEVVYVGETASDLLSDNDAPVGEPFADIGDLSGKIALTAAGFLSIKATRTLEQKNAAGIITIHPHKREPHDGIASPIWGGAPPLDRADELPSVPIVNVNAPDGEVLKGWAEEERPFHVELETNLTTDWFECPIVVAEIEAGAADTDEFVLLHGHYDSWYVGITDNATGDAGLLECARVFEEFSDQLKRNLRVAWWPGHSTGRYAGSTWYADEFALDIEEHCVAQVNMDSPGAKDTTEYTDMSCWTPECHNLVGEVIEDVIGAPYEEHFPFRAGDYSFDNLGVTGFFMLSSNIPTEEREARGYHRVGGCGGNSDAWHVSTDSLDKAGREELVRDIRLYALSILRVLTADVLPFDHLRYVDRIHETVEEYDETAGDAVDFSPALDALDVLHKTVEEFYEGVEDGDVSPSEANDTIVRLARILNRLYLVRKGKFSQDPATGRDPVPLLAPARRFPHLEGDEERFLVVQMKRAQNQVVAELHDADRRVVEVTDNE